jgi:hypothetical protein
MELRPCCEVNSQSSIQEIPNILWPEGSLPCLQESATGLHPEPDEPGVPYSISLRSILIVSSQILGE